MAFFSCFCSFNLGMHVDRKVPSKKKKVKIESIWWAASNGNLERIKQLLERSPNLKNAFEVKTGYAPLHWAVKKGHKHIIHYLLRAGASINLPDREGRTPLFWVSQLPIAQLLVKSGAVINVQDHLGKTPLHWIDTPDVVSFLIKSGADISLRDKEGKDPLQWAAGSGHSAIVELLLKAGADVNAYDKDGRMALHSAVQAGQYAIVELLLAQKGIEFDTKDSRKSRTPLQWALRMSKGAHKKHNEQNSIEVTARMMVALLRQGADPEVQDRKGKTLAFRVLNTPYQKNEKILLNTVLAYHSLAVEQRKTLINNLARPK